MRYWGYIQNLDAGDQFMLYVAVFIACFSGAQFAAEGSWWWATSVWIGGTGMLVMMVRALQKPDKVKGATNETTDH